MTWWQTILVISACTFWSAIMVIIGSALANTVHTLRDRAEAAKWQVPDAIQGHN